MIPKNTICLWYDHDALDAAEFYAATFPDSEVRGVFRSGAFVDGAFWRTPFGMALAVKLAMVASMVALSAYHDFVLGPAASRATPGSNEALSLRRKAMMTARVSALLGLVLLYAATRLARS